jgi:hypothetical protein
MLDGSLLFLQRKRHHHRAAYGTTLTLRDVRFSSRLGKADVERVVFNKPRL